MPSAVSSSGRAGQGGMNRSTSSICNSRSRGDEPVAGGVVKVAAGLNRSPGGITGRLPGVPASAGMDSPSALVLGLLPIRPRIALGPLGRARGPVVPRGLAMTERLESYDPFANLNVTEFMQ